MKIEYNPDGSLKLPESMVKSKEENKTKEKINEFTHNFWEYLNFNTLDFFKNKEYVGCFKSKRNWYYGYSYNQFFVISTGLKELPRFNIILNEEIKEVKEIIEFKFPKSFFKMADLMEVVKIVTLKSERIIFYKENQLEDQHFNPFYTLLLHACYALTIKEELVFDKLGKNVIFALNHGSKNLDKKPDIFREIIFVKSTDKSLIFKNNKFFFDIRCKDFRGSIYTYLIEEIEYLKKIIENTLDKTLNIEKIMNQMEYQQRFHDIYQMMIDKNIRNDREVYDFFISRVKSALRIIGTITNLVEIEREGRSNIYLRKN